MAYSKENARPGNTAASARARDKRYQLIASLKTKPCMDCGVSFPTECMDFDHVRGVKSFNIKAKAHAHGIQVILDEIAKCDVVCANCHRIRTTRRLREFGAYPHPVQPMPVTGIVPGSAEAQEQAKAVQRQVLVLMKKQT